MIMNDTMRTRFDSNTVFHVSAVELTSDKQDEYAITDDTVEVCNRFWRAAEALPRGGFFGWQLAAAPGKGWGASVFCEESVEAAQEDFGWIFGNCGKVKDVRKKPLAPMDTDGRTVYVLRPLGEGLPNQHASEEQEAVFNIDTLRRKGLYFSGSYVKEALDALHQAGAILRFVAAGTRDGRGAIFVSLQGEAGLRLRALLGLAFPGTYIEETAGAEEIACLPGQCLLEAMMGLLRTLLGSGFAKGFELPAGAENDQTPIEELALSTRPYNCLKRANIHTVAQLLMRSDEELRHVRNLSQKCVTEIRQKLSEYASRRETASPAESDGFAPLEELIGLQNVKEQMRKIVALAKMKQDMAERGMNQVPVVLNMAFTGNPGTAKTTVARIAARLFHETGLLDSGELVEVGRADLVARYVGQTADQVRSVFQKAKGKLLFIDEAYSLVEKDGLYGDEAINTIVQEMENHRDETVVIFAGYPDKMDMFFSKNPGLRSRIPFHIRFQDYSTEDMQQIAELEARKRGFSLLPEAREKVRSICAAAVNHSDFGNGRFCRNLVESAILNYASRVYGGAKCDTEKDFTLVNEDFAIPVSRKQQDSVHHIGFLP